MSRYWSKIVSDLEPYVPGEQPKDRRYIKLNTNENPYPPSPRVIEAIKHAANDLLKLYPDPNCEDLRDAIAKYHGVDSGNVFVGNGSDEILALAFFTFFKQDLPLLFPDVTYSFYDAYCNLFNIEAKRIPIRPDFTIDLKDYIQPNGGIIFANPNALTANCISPEEIERLLEANTGSAVVVDEAYIDFGGETAIPLIKKYPNLLIIQTLSKSRSLAGLRVGFAVGEQELIEGLDRTKNSFNSYTLDRLALAGALESIKDEEYFQETCRKVIETREWTTKELGGLGFSVVPSKANFILIQHERLPAKVLFQKLRDEGILVRYFDKPRVQNHLRVTIGTEAEMKTFVQKVRELVKS